MAPESVLGFKDSKTTRGFGRNQARVGQSREVPGPGFLENALLIILEHKSLRLPPKPLRATVPQSRMLQGACKGIL